MKLYDFFKFKALLKAIRHIMIIIMMLQFFTNNSMAQEILDKSISLTFNNISLKEALDKIEEQGNFKFMYSPELLPLKQKVTFKSENKKIGLLLIDFLKPYNVNFQQVKNYILIKEKVKNSNTTIEKLNKTIVGKVVDSQTGEGLPGANVQIKNSTVGTTTDVNGKFELKVSDESTLTFTFVSYSTREVKVGKSTVINIELSPSLQSLNQVVVIGYGEQKRKDLTSSISSIKGEKLSEVTAAGFDQALQGRVPGLQVTSSTGAPGGGVQVRIRGNSSVTGSNQPLYVVDGVPLFGNDAVLSRNLSDAAAPNPEIPAVSILSTINSTDIESIDVLKDASATAIYGARGANGVIMITTKRGKVGKPIFSFDVTTGTQQVNRFIPVINAQQYTQLVQEADFNGTALPNPIASISPDSLQRLVGNGTDWQKEIFRVAPILQVNASVRGGSENTKFNISAGYFNQEGVIIKSFFNRYNLRVNVDNQIGERCKIGVSSAITYQKTNMPQVNHFGERSVTLAAITTTPLIPVYHPTLGGFAFGPTGIGGNWGGGFVNPVRLLNQESYTTSIFRFTGNVNVEYKILPNLTFKSIFGADLVTNYQTNFRENFNLNRFITNEAVPGPGVRWKETYTNIQNILNEETLTYDQYFGLDHHLTLLGGFTFQNFVDQYTSADARGATSNDLRTFNYNQGTLRIEGNENQAKLLSFFGRAQYSYANKYLLTTTLRRDGSSRFGPDKQFAWFPSVSAGWRVSKEKFLENITWLNDLKLRASYGVTGNQDIGNFRYLALTGGTIYAFGNAVVPAVAPASLANNKLQWESNQQWDIGLDLSFLKEKLNVSIDYFNRSANDLLIQLPSPLMTGTTIDPFVNLGSVENKGLEIILSGKINKGDFTWMPSLNISTINNKIVNLGANPAGGRNEYLGISTGIQGLNGSTNIAREGYAIGSFYGWQADGIFKTNEEASSSPKPVWISANPTLQLKAGDVKYKDMNNDGIINNDDRVILGSPVPDFFGGFDNTFTYKNLSLGVLLTFQKGHKLYNYGQQNYEFNTQDYYQNYWRADRPEGTSPRAANGMAYHNNTIVSSRWVEDASFLKIRSINLTYKLPSIWLKSTKISNASINLNATNLFVLTNYKGFDPEVSGRGDGALNSGVDQVGYPSARVFNVGLNLAF